jgi:SAM-dependent methyltransferase
MRRQRAKITYDHWSAFPGWAGAPAFLSDLIVQSGAKTVLEVGSGANPTLGEEIAGRAIRYVTTDLDAAELDKAPDVHEARVLDLESNELPEDLIGRCDLVFSRMVNEHIRDGRRYHTNIRTLLRPGGIAAHCFATLYSLPFVANAVLPEAIGGHLLDLIAPRDRYQNDKFRAHYSWCRGPTDAMIRRFRGIGYEILSYNGYFGHGYYRRIQPLHKALQTAACKLTVLPIPQLCSYATVVLRRDK